MAIDDELEEMLRAAEASGQAVACDANVFLYWSGRWVAFLPRQEVIKRARRGKPRLAVAPLEFADRLLGTPEEYLALFRSGQVRLYGGVTSDNVFSPDTEAEFLRLTTYMMVKGTGQYWLQFAG